MYYAALWQIHAPSGIGLWIVNNTTMVLLGLLVQYTGMGDMLHGHMDKCPYKLRDVNLFFGSCIVNVYNDYILFVELNARMKFGILSQRMEMVFAFL